MLSDKEKEKLMLVHKDTYPQRMLCGACGYYWLQHKGELCPAEGSVDWGSPGWRPGETRFIPTLDPVIGGEPDKLTPAEKQELDRWLAKTLHRES